MGAALSVILVAPRAFRYIEKTLQHLAAQTRRADIELLVVARAENEMQLDSPLWQGFYAVHIFQVGPVTNPTTVKVRAAQAASAPIIAFAEDHSFPSPTWADTLLAAHAEPHAAVAVEMRNANPRSALSWADLMLSFGAWAAPAPRGCMSGLPGHNISYKRRVLETYRAQLPELLTSESVFCIELTRAGHTLYLDNRAHAAHLNISKPGAFFVSKFLGGRIFGGLRAGELHWSRARRIAYALGAPLVPFVRFRRMWRDLQRTGKQRDILSRFGLAVWLGLLVHACGEAVGYLFGVGDAPAKYAPIEMERADQLAAQDLPLAFPASRQP